MLRIIVISLLTTWLVIYFGLYKLTAGSVYFLYFSILTTCLLQILVPLWRLARKNADPFEPFFMFLFLFLFYYFLHPLLILLEGPLFRQIPSPLTPELAARMYYVINISTLSFYIGYFLWSGRPGKPRRLAGIPRVEDGYRFDPRAKENRKLAVVFIIIGILAFISMVGGSLGYYLTHLGTRAFFIRGKGVLFLVTFFTGVGALLYWYYSVCSKNREHLLFRGMIFLGVLGLYLFEGSRGHVFIVLLAGILSFHYKVRPVRVKEIAAAALVVIVLFNAFHFFRGRQIRQERGTADAPLGVRSPPRISYFHRVIRQMFLSTEQLLVVLNAPPQKKLWGINYLEPVITFIPSAIWPDKPNVNLGYFYSTHYFPGIKERGISFGPGVIGAPLLNFGIIGVLLQFFLLGLGLKGMYRLLLVHKDSHHFFLLYALSISVFIFIGISRGVVPSLTMLLFFLIPYGVFVFLRFLLLFAWNTTKRSNNDPDPVPDPNP